MGLVHWDDIDPVETDLWPLRFRRFDLGSAAGTGTVGLKREQVDAGGQSAPVHVHGDEEEIFYVLGGTGLAWQEGKTFEVRAGDCLVYRAGGQTHMLIGGPEGLDVLAFGERSSAALTYLPRPRVVRLGALTLDVPEGEPPFVREAEQGELDVPAPTARPPNAVNASEVEPMGEPRKTVSYVRRDLGRAAGSLRTGLKVIEVAPGLLSAPPHCHSAEEELFVVLEGAGTLELTPAPDRIRKELEAETHAVRRGHVVARPAGTGIAHAFRAAEEGLTLLAYGTRKPNDIAYYPRSGKLFWRGAGVIARVEHVDYWVDED